MRNEIKEIIAESVLEYLNRKTIEPTILTEEQKKEIADIVRKNYNRPGLLGFTYKTNIEEGKTSFGVRVDPTAKGDWILSKEEILYEMNIKYNDVLHDFVKSLRKELTK